MARFWKAVREDGTDFYSGTLNYAEALATGKPVRVQQPAGNSLLRLCGPGVLHAATVPGETLIGGTWPCQLLVVEGRPLALDYSEHPYKRGFASLRPVEEVPAWQALGPNGQEVVTLIERAKRITANEAKALTYHVAWGAAWDAAWLASQDAAQIAGRYAAWDAARYVAWDAARRVIAQDSVWVIARDAVRDAARALVVRDLLMKEQYQTLAGSWLSVVSP